MKAPVNEFMLQQMGEVLDRQLNPALGLILPDQPAERKVHFLLMVWDARAPDAIQSVSAADRDECVAVMEAQIRRRAAGF